MRHVVNVTTRRDADKNQIVTNINYGQKSLFNFIKTFNTQIKMASDKIYTKEY